MYKSLIEGKSFERSSTTGCVSLGWLFLTHSNMIFSCTLEDDIDFYFPGITCTLKCLRNYYLI